MHLTPDAVVHRPHLAIDVARVATYWSDLELHFGIAYTYLVGERDKDAFAAYYALRDWHKRKRMFDKEARDRGLPGPLKAAGHALYDEFEVLAALRNSVVHGAWAYSPEHELSLFLAQPRELGWNILRALRSVDKVVVSPDRYPSLSVDLSPQTYAEYRHEDFEEIIAKISALRLKIIEFENGIGKFAVDRMANAAVQARLSQANSRGMK